MSDRSKIDPLILCPVCRIEMRLFEIKAESPVRDLFSFECVKCGRIEGRGVLVSAPESIRR
jgi:hypothetical protein